MKYMMQSWLSSIDLKEVKLIGLKIRSSNEIRDLIGHHIQTLKSFRMEICKVASAEMLKEVSRLWSTMPALEHYSIHKAITRFRQGDSWSRFHFGNINSSKLSYQGNVKQYLLEQIRIEEQIVAGRSSALF
jgi:hypothetical protein